MASLTSQAETATTLGISEKAVETRLYRARARLKRILGTEGNYAQPKAQGRGLRGMQLPSLNRRNFLPAAINGDDSALLQSDLDVPRIIGPRP